MRTLLLILTLALSHALTAFAADEKPVKGSFIMSVDDHASIFVNGKKVFHGDIGSSRSKETELKMGDRIVAHLVNDGGPKHFILVFASTDGKTTISFRAEDFKIMPQSGVYDFKPDEFKEWTKTAHKFKGSRGLDKIVRNYSDYLWGDMSNCTIACTITKPMFVRPN